MGGHSRPEVGFLSAMQWHHYDAAAAWDVHDRSADLEGLEVETGGHDLPELEGLEVETGGEDLAANDAK